jgi:hypothetical protein
MSRLRPRSSILCRYAAFFMVSEYHRIFFTILVPERVESCETFMSPWCSVRPARAVIWGRATTAAVYDGSRLRYPNGLTNEGWGLIRPLIVRPCIRLMLVKLCPNTI